MIVFGWGSGSKRLGDGFFLTCTNCHNANAFSVVEASKKITVYWLPVAKWDKTYFHICPVCSNGVQIPSRELAQRILAGAFRDPYQPTPALAQALRQALSPNTSSSASEGSESVDDSLNREPHPERPTEAAVKEVQKSAGVVESPASVQVLEPRSKPQQKSEPVHHSSPPPQSAAVASTAAAEAMNSELNRSVASEPDPVVMRVDGTSSFVTLQEHRRRGWKETSKCDLSQSDFRGVSFS